MNPLIIKYSIIITCLLLWMSNILTTRYDTFVLYTTNCSNLQTCEAKKLYLGSLMSFTEYTTVQNDPNIYFTNQTYVTQKFWRTPFDTEDQCNTLKNLIHPPSEKSIARCNEALDILNAWDVFGQLNMYSTCIACWIILFGTYCNSEMYGKKTLFGICLCICITIIDVTLMRMAYDKYDDFLNAINIDHTREIQYCYIIRIFELITLIFLYCVYWIYIRKDKFNFRPKYNYENTMQIQNLI